MSDQGQYEATLRTEASAAEQAGEQETAARLRALADSADEMTPAERTWLGEADEEQLRGFALRSGCAPAEAR